MGDYDSTIRNGLIAVNLTKDDELVRVMPDHRQRRHLHGVGEGPDDSVLRERGTPDGSRHGPEYGACSCARVTPLSVVTSPSRVP